MILLWLSNLSRKSPPAVLLLTMMAALVSVWCRWVSVMSWWCLQVTTPVTTELKLVLTALFLVKFALIWTFGLAGRLSWVRCLGVGVKLWLGLLVPRWVLTVQLLLAGCRGGSVLLVVTCNRVPMRLKFAVSLAIGRLIRR